MTDPRSNIIYREIILSAAYQLLEAENLPAVLRKLDEFIPFDQVRHQHSNMESFLQERIDFLKSKTLRYQGNFPGSLKSLEELIRRIDRQFSNLGCGIIANYGEVLCELGRLTDAEKHLRD